MECKNWTQTIRFSCSRFVFSISGIIAKRLSRHFGSSSSLTWGMTLLVCTNCRRGKREDRELALEFRHLCCGSNRIGMSLPFELVFATKQANSTGLQFADLVARPIGMSVLRAGQDNRAFDVLKRKFYCRGGRSKAGEDFEDWGLKLFPVPESEKPR